MAHNLATIEGRIAFASANTAAWHKLGITVDHAMTWQEAVSQAQLDWLVEKQPLFSQRAERVEAFGIFRQEAAKQIFLGAVGAQYTPIQNIAQFDFVDAVLGAKNDAHYEAAGALGNGEKVWCLANLAEVFEVVPGDKHETFLLFTTSHDGSTAAQCGLTDVRVVCNNTLKMALSKNGSTFTKVRHTPSADAKLKFAQESMSTVVSDVHELRDRLRLLSTRRVKREQASDIFDRLFPKGTGSDTRRQNIVADILGLYESNDRNAFPEIRGTAYNLLNAVTEYTDHSRTARVTREGYDQSRARAESALFGSGSSFKQEALDVILKCTDGSEVIERRYVDVPTSMPVGSGPSLLDDVLANTLM